MLQPRLTAHKPPASTHASEGGTGPLKYCEEIPVGLLPSPRFSVIAAQNEECRVQCIPPERLDAACRQRREIPVDKGTGEQAVSHLQQTIGREAVSIGRYR